MQDADSDATAAATVIAADDADDIVDETIDGGRGDTTGQREEFEMNRHVPWQMEWKHPQWITSSPSSSSSPPLATAGETMERENGNDDDDDAEVIGITSARLSRFEISQILSFGDGDDLKRPNTTNSETHESSKAAGSKSSCGNGQDRHYLLTVTLLGTPADKPTPSTLAAKNDNKNDNESSSTAIISNAEKPSTSSRSLSLASEVLLEVLDVPSSDSDSNSNSNDTSKAATARKTTRVIRTKRLRWPESIFDATIATKDSNSNSTNTKAADAASAKRRRKQTKRKNLLEKVFLPLMGIDEEDEYGERKKSAGAENNSSASSSNRKQPTLGIVSAALCRRPEEDLLAATKDIVELMSFGTRGGGNGRERRIGNDRGDSSATKKEDISSAAEASGLKDSKLLVRKRQQQQQQQIHENTTEDNNCGELSFVCVSRAGEVFVYDPIKLLLGIEDVSGFRDGEKEAKKSLELASTFFFGQELFQNLQETWKPLAEPSTRICLSLFEHDDKKQRFGATKKNPEHSPVENLVQSNKELSEMAQSVLSRDNKSTGSNSSCSSRADMNETKHRKHDNRIGSEGSVTAPRSSGDDGGDSSTIVTSATDALTVVQTMALELQTNVDEALSMLPYLLNPLLEPSTLKDRTVRNRPLAITVTGSAYVVVTGSGLKRKKQAQRKSNLTTKPGRRRRDNNADNSSAASFVSTSNHGNMAASSSPSRGTPLRVQIGEETSDANNEVGATALSPEASGDDNANTNPISESIEETKDDVGKETITINSSGNNDPHFGQDENSTSNKSNEAMLGRETPLLVYGDDSDNDNPSDNAEETSKSDGGNEDKIEGAIEKVIWWENDGAADQEDNAGYNIENTSKPDGENKDQNEAEWWENDSAANLEDKVRDKASVSIGNDEGNSQRHYFDGYENDCGGDDMQDRGGFVTFLSTVHWSETRTLFLPFVPIRTSHISQWNGMELLWVIGEFETLLIRMDSTGPIPVRIGDVLFGGEILNHEDDLFQTTTASARSRTTFAEGIGSGSELSPLSVKKFQILPIDLGTTASTSRRLLCASNTGIDPPSILELQPIVFEEIATNNQSRHQLHRYQEALVLFKTLGYCTPQGTVVLRHAPSHVAKIMISQDKAVALANNPNKEESFLDDASMWAEQGQGWALVGSKRHIHFICWEGSTLLQGAYVKELNHSPHLTSYKPVHTTHILPLSTNRDLSLETSSHHHSEMVVDEGMSTERHQVFEHPERFSSAIVNLPLIDEFQPPVSSNVDNDEQFRRDMFSPKGRTGAFSDSLKITRYSRRQNSEYLLQQCSSWTQLEDTLNDRIVLERQEPVLCLRSGKAGSPHSMISLRQLVVDNGIASPFQQVLAWLAKRKNFFVAAGIALDLLQDADSLYHLWKHAEMIDEEDEEMKLVGLLDGIAPIRLLDDNQRANEHKHSVTATHLSEMTVGCFIKGGATMAKTLERFLESNKSYNPARVSLMLALTTVNVFANNPMGIRNSNTLNLNVSIEEDFFDELLWPIKCLLGVGTERKYLNEVLALLNNTIPDELRHRHSKDEIEEDQEISTSTLTLTKKIIQLILESDPGALEVLMGFVDDRSGTIFWQSLGHGTRLALSLMEINTSFPFLSHPDARAWARGELDLCFQGQSDLPTAWLQELSFACLWNASCDLDDLRIIDDSNDRLLGSTESEDNDMLHVTGDHVTGIAPPDLNTGCRDNYVGKMQFEIEKTRNALLPSTNKRYGIDHDLLIPSLLLLENRNEHWLPPSQLPPSSTGSSPSVELYVPTQSLLNAACYLAGRIPSPSSATSPVSFPAVPCDPSDDEPFLFAEFDGKSAMKQCFRAKNVVAGAYLIGGTNGFILHVCDVLNGGVGISIPNAESFLLNDRLDLKIIDESKTEKNASFELTNRHQKLLLLLDEHVLGIKTFGDFDFVHNRGRVDPVFAARSILRSWLSLSLGDKAAASRWLGEWLRDRLKIRTLSSVSSSASVATNDLTPRSKTTKSTKSFDDTDATDGNNNPEVDRGSNDSAPNMHRLACASLARSLLWPNNEATPKVSSGDAFTDDETSSIAKNDSVPLAATMEFEKKLLIELCQSCLGLVGSVPSAVVREMQI